MQRCLVEKKCFHHQQEKRLSKEGDSQAIAHPVIGCFRDCPSCNRLPSLPGQILPYSAQLIGYDRLSGGGGLKTLWLKITHKHSWTKTVAHPQAKRCIGQLGGWVGGLRILTVARVGWPGNGWGVTGCQGGEIYRTVGRLPKQFPLCISVMKD